MSITYDELLRVAWLLDAGYEEGEREKAKLFERARDNFLARIPGLIAEAKRERDAGIAYGLMGPKDESELAQ